MAGNGAIGLMAYGSRNAESSSQAAFAFLPASARRWLGWARSAGAAAVVAVLIALGVANVVLHLGVHELEDGVLWSLRPEGVVATEIARGSAAALAGVQRGDVLIAVNASPVQTISDVFEHQHRATPGAR